MEPVKKLQNRRYMTSGRGSGDDEAADIWTSWSLWMDFVGKPKIRELR